MVHKRQFILLFVVLAVVTGGLLAWRYNLVPEIGKFFAAEPGTAHFVGTQGSQFIVDGAPYTVKGFMTTTFDVSGHLNNLNVTDDGSLEQWSYGVRIWRDFDETALDNSMAFFASLGVNTLRVLTPSNTSFDNNVYWHCFEPWYLTQGTVARWSQCGSDFQTPIGALPGQINPLYRDRLIKLLDIAYRHGVRIDLGISVGAPAESWECRSGPDAASPWSACSVGDLAGSVAQFGTDAVRLIRPGSDREQFALAYLDSLVPYLKDNPGLFSYEVGNENLQHWPLNGLGVSGNEWYQNQIGSYLRRMIARIRQLDPNHLIGSGEVAYMSVPETYWAYPTGEFGSIADIDNLNNGQPYTLESLVDFVGAHLYSYMATAGEAPGRVQAARTRTTKPIVFGEFNAYEDWNGWPPPDGRAYPESNAFRADYFRMGLDLVRQGIAQGFFVFDPVPGVMAPPDKWVLSDSILFNGVPSKGVIIPGTPQRQILGVDVISSLFAGDTTSPYGLRLLDEGKLLVDAWKPTASSTTLPSTSTLPSSSPPSSPPAVKDGDLDGDNDVDIFDYNAVVGNFGHSGEGDTDGDGDVDIFDYNAVVSNFGR